MHIKPIQAKIIGGIIVIAGIILVGVNIAGLKISADEITTAQACSSTTSGKKVAACISNVTPQSIEFGQDLTLTGTNFSTSKNNFVLVPANDHNNIFRFVKGSVKSSDGTTLTINLPKDIYGHCFMFRLCHKGLKPGQYEIQVDPNNAKKSNFYPITIVSNDNKNNITLSKSSGTVGTQITITSDSATAFTPTGNSITFNGSKNTIINLDSTDGKTLTFTIPTNTSSLDGPDAEDYTNQPVAAGVYTISAVNGNGEVTNDQNFTVTDTTNDTTTNTTLNSTTPDTTGTDTTSPTTKTTAPVHQDVFPATN